MIENQMDMFLTLKEFMKERRKFFWFGVATGAVVTFLVLLAVGMYVEGTEPIRYF